MTPEPGIEELLRAVAPQALGAVLRRHRDFSEAEDATQEALAAAAAQWPVEGRPANPVGWLVRVASRRLADQHRRDEARRRREELTTSWSSADPGALSGRDDTLTLMYLCCHPALTPGAAIPLTLRAVGGLTTREIAAPFLVPEATMAQRISRAKARLKAAGATFEPPTDQERVARLRSVLHVLYLMFNEGYATSSGPDLVRDDLSGEAIRLARLVRAGLPDDPEVTALLALMLLTDARRPARTGPAGELVPLAEQDRTTWDEDRLTEGFALVAAALSRGGVGEYQVQAAIAAAHDRERDARDTDWAEIAALYRLLERIAPNPMVTLNRAVAVAMADGPDAGLDLLAGLDEQLGDHARLLAVRAHLQERAGDWEAAIAGFRAAAARTANLREQQFLMTQAARLSWGPGPTR